MIFAEICLEFHCILRCFFVFDLCVLLGLLLAWFGLDLCWVFVLCLTLTLV